MVRKVLALLIVVLAMTQAALAASCGGEGDSSTGNVPVVTGPPGDVQAVIRQMVDRYNATDVAAYLALYTDAGLDSQYHLTREEAATILPGVIGHPPVSIFRFVQTNVSGNGADADVLVSAGQVASEEQFKLVNDAGVWKIDDYVRLSAHNPAGRVTVTVSLVEFGFDFDRSLIKDGDISFKFTNEGQQRHEIILDRIPHDMDLEEEIKGGEPPDGGEPISFLGIMTPGETKRLVTQDPLPPGRYVFLCFMPDADDPGHTPHALKGMHAEFTVPPGSPTPEPSP